MKVTKEIKRNYCMDCKHCDMSHVPGVPAWMAACKVNYTVDLVSGERINTRCSRIRERVDHCPKYQKKVTFFRILKHLFYLVKLKLS